MTRDGPPSRAYARPAQRPSERDATQAGAAAAGGLTGVEAARRLAEIGPNAVAEAPERLLARLGEKLWAPLPWMLEATIALELFLAHWAQAVVIAFLLVFNTVLGLSQESKAKTAVAALKQKLAVVASVRRDGAWQRVAAQGLVPGDLVKLALGTVVPADVAITEGTVLLDQAMLTGESLPVERGAGTVAYAGAFVRRGEAIGTVTATGPRTYFGRTASLVEEASSISGEQRAVLGVVRDLAVVNGAVAVAMLAYAHAIGLSFDESIPLLLTALLASIPVALPSTFTLAAALSARRLARGTVLPTRLAAINEAASMSLLCSDKTGTLTKDALSIHEVVGLGGADEQSVLGLAAAASSEGGDPIDQVIRDEARRRAIAIAPVASFVPFDPAKKCAEASLAGGTLVRKGAFAVVASSTLSPEAARAYARLAAAGCRVLGVAKENGDRTVLVGLIGLADPPREDARPIVNAIEALGVRVVMVTGDAPATAHAIAREIGIEGKVCDAAGLRSLRTPEGYGVFAGVFPEDKFHLVKLFQEHGHVVGMCGDGANDAPALRQAQMGIAVSSATDVAKAAAGLVLTAPGLGGILDAIREGRGAFRRIRTYTVSMVVRKIAFVLALAFGLVVTGHAVLTPLLMVLLLIVNDFLTMAIATDRATPSARPERWRVGEIMRDGGLYGVATLAFVLAALFVARAAGLVAIAQLRTLTFLVLMLAVQAVIYVVRVPGWFWSSRPSRWLAAASGLTIAASLAAAYFGILMTSLPASTLLAIVLAAFVFLLLLSASHRAAHSLDDRRQARRSLRNQRDGNHVAPSARE